MKGAIPAALCFAGLLTCTFLALRRKPEAQHYRVEITVRRPDGTVIPVVRHK